MDLVRGGGVPYLRTSPPRVRLTQIMVPGFRRSIIATHITEPADSKQSSIADTLQGVITLHTGVAGCAIDRDHRAAGFAAVNVTDSGQAWGGSRRYKG